MECYRGQVHLNVSNNFDMKVTDHSTKLMHILTTLHLDILATKLKLREKNCRINKEEMQNRHLFDTISHFLCDNTSIFF